MVALDFWLSVGVVVVAVAAQLLLMLQWDVRLTLE